MASNRPLSPHLKIFKLQITSLLSIFHRLTGIFLCTAVFGLIAWVWAVGSGEEAYYAHQSFYQTVFGKIILFLWLTTFYYHLFNGFRHLAWDVGWGFKIPVVERTGKLVLGITTILSLLTFISLF